MKRLVLAIVAIIVVIVVGSGVFLLDKSRKNKEYEEGLHRAYNLIISNSNATKLVIDLNSLSWQASFGVKADAEAIIISLVMASIEDRGILNRMQYNHSQIEVLIKKLKEYPLKYKESYSAILELYLLYVQLYDFSINPSGTWLIYNQQVSDLKSQLTKTISKTRLYLPEADSFEFEKPLVKNNNLLLTEHQPEKIIGHYIIVLEDFGFTFDSMIGYKNMKDEEWVTFRNYNKNIFNELETEEIKKLALTRETFITFHLKEGRIVGYKYDEKEDVHKTPRLIEEIKRGNDELDVSDKEEDNMKEIFNLDSFDVEKAFWGD